MNYSWKNYYKSSVTYSIYKALSEMFDYKKIVFGDEEIIDLQRKNWGAIRLSRCLKGIRNVKGNLLELGYGAGRCVSTINYLFSMRLDVKKKNQFKDIFFAVENKY